MWKKALLILAVILLVAHFSGLFEGFENPSTKIVHGCPEGYRQCGGGDCVLVSDKHAPCPGKADAY